MKIHLATGNLHKAWEMQALADASRLPVQIVAPGVMPPVLEDTGTFAGNARKKAAALKAALAAGSWVLADDSGLCVDALDGAPGVESAYYAGPQGDGVANLQKLTEVMQHVPDGQRGAHFVCVLVLLGPDGLERVFEGRCEGTLCRKPAGDFGFGYDPLFVPEGCTTTYAGLSDAAKNKISHRGGAWLKLVEWLESTRRDPAVSGAGLGL